MAENKKSFILYADQEGLFEKLTDAKAGKLIKLIYAYVNDKNPKPEDVLLQVAFEPIKLQLKRDLKDWEQQREKRSEAGKKGMEKRWGTTENITKDNSVIPVITKITDTVNVNDNVTVINNNKKESDFLCYDAEEFLLNNQIAFEKICIATGRSTEEAKTFIHEYHLWMAKKENYPVGKKAVAAGVESWILNSKKFIKNGTTTFKSGNRTAGQNESFAKLLNIGNKEYAAATGTENNPG